MSSTLRVLYAKTFIQNFTSVFLIQIPRISRSIGKTICALSNCLLRIKALLSSDLDPQRIEENDWVHGQAVAVAHAPISPSPRATELDEAAKRPSCIALEESTSRTVMPGHMAMILPQTACNAAWRLGIEWGKLPS
ncbi:hypothetical protein [Pseudomonas baetica]|uniref:hypothetical protein n=1 Tax=Pseudomonas baetica TaxID=674054 RepID=UPI003B8A6D9C